MGRTSFWLMLGLVLVVSHCSGNGSGDGSGDAVSEVVDCLGCDLGRWEQLAETTDLSVPEAAAPDAAADAEVLVDVSPPGDAAPDAGDGTQDQQEAWGDALEVGDSVLMEDFVDTGNPFPDLSEMGKGCGEALQCGHEQGCLGPDDVECWAPCVEGVSELAAWKLDALAECYETHCAEATSATAEMCRQQYCTLELMVCTGGAGDLSCGGVLDCLMGCPPTDPACRTACMSEASQATVGSAYLVVESAAANSLEVWLLHCFGGEGEDECYQTQECLIDCGFGIPGVVTNPPCLIACLKNSSPEAMEMWLEMFACCEEEVLFSLMVSCVGGNGQLSCDGVLDCLAGCNPTDPACFYNCLKQTAPDAVEAVHGYFLCVEETCPPALMPACPDLAECAPICVGEEEPDGDE